MLEETSSTRSKRLSSQTRKCPVCESVEISELHPTVGPVCERCGAIVDDFDQKPLIYPESDEPSESPRDWSEYYTVTNSTEQQLADALDVLERISDQLYLDANERKRVADVYAEAALANLTDGRSAEVVIGAVVAIVTRENKTPRPVGCVADVADVRQETLTRIQLRLARELELSVPPGLPVDYLPFLRQRLQLDKDAEADAREILDTLDHGSLGGKNPVGFACAALYLAIEGSITQRKLARVTGITEETLRVRLKDCRKAI